MKQFKYLFLPVLMFILTALSSCENIKKSKYITIGMVDGWAEDVAMTHVAKAILDKQGYHVIIQKASTDMILASMNNEDTDLFMGVWLPYTHAKKLAKFPGLTHLGTNYDNGRIGLVVPEYVPIKSIEELNQQKDQFSHRIIGIEKGAGLTTGTDKAIIDYQLDYQQINSSTIAMITELQNAIQRKEWIVVTGWQPHWMFGKMKLKFLDDPKKIFGEAEQIKTYSRKSFAKDHPELAKFFSKVHFDDENMSDLLMKMEQSKNKETTAKEWVEDHAELVQSWLDKN
ncbi:MULTISPECIES: glycine betaine ABC transporter substrate-binding protein [Chryseobacterium]|uniref:Glycine betaine ABC transporter substrate-binding protein n=1 Tax=Chryseobacterium candidae TaxID=1978493 RepID=A0ABY2R9F2_9FLAO|nr:MULTISPECIES: glycine betaine ABC transporter substrate-binding protein [Chryseobacterium]PXW12638.1 glycine betaine/proline transport system substrate-binding protein [Chryseobacterium sp. CBTAP 102]THV62141.1 glycine betaine ABC transporter substrate-binding protein [Chryseobacterium candidae]SIQ85294.1 glycine betaine/proline transport system substrate-binding protein [Chryseobacterium sp. RU33C]